VHVHTIVSSNGCDAMPHWRTNEFIPCREGSIGAQTPQMLAPMGHEKIITKRYYSAFETGELDTYLKAQKVDLVILAGLYTHACIRSAALEAYSLGYQVLIALDAVGSPDHLHAELTREYLEKREILFVESDIIKNIFESKYKSVNHDSIKSYITEIKKKFIQINPSNTSKILLEYELLSNEDIQNLLCKTRLAASKWGEKDIQSRAKFLLRWQNNLEENRSYWVEKIVEEVGKPLKDAAEEFQRAIDTITTVINVGLVDVDSNNHYHVLNRSVGTVLCITPWNNPIAIPIGKIAPALMYGNSVVWKPSVLSTRVSALLLDSLRDVGLLDNLVVMLSGGAETARLLIKNPIVSRVSLTGSITTGKMVSSLCTANGKLLQAELGGNNAVIILPGIDFKLDVPRLVRSAFSFAGQRCTAYRRFIVDRAIEDEFINIFMDETRKLVVGDPRFEETDIGPLISKDHFESVMFAIRDAENKGVQVLQGGKSIESELGYWIIPTILKTQQSDLDIVQNETFGPVVVIQVSDNFDQAVQLSNSVKHGLISGIVGGSLKQIEAFKHRIEAGMLKISTHSMGIDLSAPFTGWKDSSIGIPEHGRWDKEFYSRVQVVYLDQNL